MKQKIDLTQGNIALKLTQVAIPIMLTGFIQMAYNLTDLFWIGGLGSGAIASLGSAGFFTWLGMAVVFLSKIGQEVCVAQSAGKNDMEGLKHYIVNGLVLAVVLAVLYGTIVFTFTPQLIGFFRLGVDVNGFNPTQNAIVYLRIICTGMIFAFLNPCFSGIYIGLGKSKLPFYLNGVGLVLNMILDPLLIYGYWGFPRWEVAGAAIATIIAQLVVTLLFAISLKLNFDFLKDIRCFFKIKKEYYLRIIKIGFPPAIQGALFAGFAIIMARIISQWGAVAIAVQRLGSQIEAISWMTSSGFSSALSAFVGQNYGASSRNREQGIGNSSQFPNLATNYIDRIWKGYTTAITIMGCIGIFASLLLILIPEQLFGIFVNEPDTIRAGALYLIILGYSQLFMCLEITTAGAFNGLGKSVPPSIVSIIGNFIRIPVALMIPVSFGLAGIWWVISGSSILKGIVLVAWFVWYFKRRVRS